MDKYKNSNISKISNARSKASIFLKSISKDESFKATLNDKKFSRSNDRMFEDRSDVFDQLK